MRNGLPLRQRSEAFKRNLLVLKKNLRRLKHNPLRPRHWLQPLMKHHNKRFNRRGTHRPPQKLRKWRQTRLVGRQKQQRLLQRPVLQRPLRLGMRLWRRPRHLQRRLRRLGMRLSRKLPMLNRHDNRRKRLHALLQQPLLRKKLPQQKSNN